MNLLTKLNTIFLTFHPFLEQNVIEVNNIQELKKVFNWKKDPIVERHEVNEYKSIEDINERKKRDAEVIGTVVSNISKKTILEIGTATGITTAFMAANAPDSHIYTINILDDDIHNGTGGINTTVALKKDEIGKEYKKLGLKNITQIYENTAHWQPNIGQINVALIDGCHDTNYVYHDTLKVLAHMLPGDFVMWHDFNPSMRKKFYWIDDVCRGVELLYKKGHIKGRIYLLKDSWVGLYCIPQKT